MRKKTCTKCEQVLALTEFYEEKRGRYGLRGKCKKCCNASSAKHYKANREAMLAQHREWRETNRESIRAYFRERTKNLTREQITKHNASHKAYQSRNPIKISAKNQANHAIRSGRLIRKPCERCSRTTHIHAHHEDYTKPLDVVWLCSGCHGDRHREINEEVRVGVK